MPITSEEFRKRFPQITEHINDKEVTDFIGMLNYVSASKNTKIISDNNKNDTLYFVIEGSLDCHIEKDDSKIKIGDIFPGEYIGEVSMLDNGNATSSVTTKTPCAFYTLDRSSFNKLEKEYPAISGKLLRSISSVLIHRLIATNKLLFNGITDKDSTSLHKDVLKVTSIQDYFLNIYHKLHH